MAPHDKREEYRDLCVLAMSKITDQKILAEIAQMTYPNYNRYNPPKNRDRFVVIGMTAVEKITDQHILAEIAIVEMPDISLYGDGVIIAALKKITDQNILAEIAIKSKYVGGLAIKKM